MVKILSDISLRPYNSFGIDAKAQRLVEWADEDSLMEFLRSEHSLFGSQQGPWDILGAGCNTLFTKDFCGTLLHSVAQGIEITAQNDHEVIIRVEAGHLWDDVVAWATEQGLWGIENLSAIPSSVGASAVQNIGAYGAEAKDAIVSVEMIDLGSLAKVTLANQYCDFGYRHSIFKTTLFRRVVITAVNYRLLRQGTPRLDYGTLREEVEKRGEPTPQTIREAVVAIRQSKLPDHTKVGNAGSFFKNPILPREQVEALKATYPTMPTYEVAGEPDKLKIATGWMIDSLGWKGRTLGQAGVHDKQALVLINCGGATGQEVITLANTICNEVKEHFGVDISPEVNIL